MQLDTNNLRQIHQSLGSIDVPQVDVCLQLIELGVMGGEVETGFLPESG